MYQVNNIVKNQARFMQEDQERCKNGWKRSTRHIIFRWIILTLKDDVPYITSPCRLIHETRGEINIHSGFIQISLSKYRKQKFSIQFWGAKEYKRENEV